ncbi:hypothetical protein [Paenibacillus sp. MMO-58]|uniref:hypothetical protein n=1 Tax=Paenibacillus sp. MMO-58 TaxID=3081290 RepID=UPI003016D8AA
MATRKRPASVRGKAEQRVCGVEELIAELQSAAISSACLMVNLEILSLSKLSTIGTM